MRLSVCVCELLFFLINFYSLDAGKVKVLYLKSAGKEQYCNAAIVVGLFISAKKKKLT